MSERESPSPIHRGLHIVITEQNQREMMASVNPISPRMKDWFRADRSALHNLLQNAQKIVPENTDGSYSYAVNAVPLMVGGHFALGARNVQIKFFRGLPNLIVAERWGTNARLTCKYSFNEKRRLFLDREVLAPLEDEVKPSDIRGFTGLRGLPPFVSVAETRQIRQTIANDLTAIRMTHGE